MAYISPETVLVPKDVVRSVEVLYNSGVGGFSVALLDWNGEEAVGIRWNGEEDSGLGNPQSRGKPTWFLVPDELSAAVRERAEELNHAAEGGLLAGYAEMAKDEEREREAQEWSEGLIGDASS